LEAKNRKLEAKNRKLEATKQKRTDFARNPSDFNISSARKSPIPQARTNVFSTSLKRGRGEKWRPLQRTAEKGSVTSEWTNENKKQKIPDNKITHSGRKIKSQFKNQEFRKIIP
jgi:hypothetical protein